MNNTTDSFVIESCNVSRTRSNGTRFTWGALCVVRARVMPSGGVNRTVLAKFDTRAEAEAFAAAQV